MGSFGAILLPVAREKGHNRANPKPFAVSAFPSTFLAVVTPYYLFTTDSWSSSVSGVSPFVYFSFSTVSLFVFSSLISVFVGVFAYSVSPTLKQRTKFCVMVRQRK